MPQTTSEFFDKVILEKGVIDRFLDPNHPNWAVFDKEVGYLLKNCVIKDGQDDSYSVYNYLPTGERKIINYSDMPCRINTYGNSFTQCHQVSDGETWQEYLAAHIGEPIRNFGIGGHGVYQAYKRILRAEKTEVAGEYIILNIFSDDHLRNIYTWRGLHTGGFRKAFKETYLKDEVHRFHSNPWDYMWFNADTGEFEEHENLFPTPESLYKLCDKKYVYEIFKDRFDVQALLAMHHVTDCKTEIIQKVADVLKIKTDFSTPESIASTADTVIRQCALLSTLYILDKLRVLCKKENKKLIILLSYSQKRLIDFLEGKGRLDDIIIEYLNENKVPYVDILKKHVEDYKVFKIPALDYCMRYHVHASGAAVFGHYNPSGNLFFAFAIKDKIVDTLDPKPAAYRDILLQNLQNV